MRGPYALDEVVDDNAVFVFIKRLMKRGADFLGCDYAVLGGAMSWISERNLVSALSNAGAFGVIACGAMTPDLLDTEGVKRVRAIVDAGTWADGNATSGPQSALAKRNEQLPEDSAAAVRHMPNGKLRVIESLWGHRAGSPNSDPKDVAFVEQAIRDLLAIPA